MSFKTIKTGEANLDRVQQNVSTAFDELNNADDHNVGVVSISAAYTCTGLEDVIGIASGSPVITLQAAKKQKRKLILTPQGGTATAQTPDRSFSVMVSDKSVTLVPKPDGTGYWQV